MTSVWFCLIAVLAAAGLQKDIVSEQAKGIRYRLLELDRRQPGNTEIAGYAISIDRFLDRPQVEQLICQMLRNEKPVNFSMLSILIFYNLDAYIPGGFPSFDRERREHYIAIYRWALKIPVRPDRLVLYRDAKSNLLDPPRFFEFDHRKACTQEVKQTN